MPSCCVLDVSAALSDALQRTFFPPTYMERSPTPSLVPGNVRQHTSLKILVEVRESVTLRLPTRESSKDWQYDGIVPLADTRRKKDKRPFGWLDLELAPASYVEYSMSMVADLAGFRNALEVKLPNVSLTSSVNGAKWWTNDMCRVSTRALSRFLLGVLISTNRSYVTSQHHSNGTPLEHGSSTYLSRPQ